VLDHCRNNADVDDERTQHGCSLQESLVSIIHYVIIYLGDNTAHVAIVILTSASDLCVHGVWE
jgi:hypothetical protein